MYCHKANYSKPAGGSINHFQRQCINPKPVIHNPFNLPRVAYYWLKDFTVLLEMIGLPKYFLTRGRFYKSQPAGGFLT